LNVVEKSHPVDGFDVLIDSRWVEDLACPTFHVQADAVIFDSYVATNLDIFEDDFFSSLRLGLNHVGNEQRQV
jgi:hypothetical protein